MAFKKCAQCKTTVIDKWKTYCPACLKQRQAKQAEANLVKTRLAYHAKKAKQPPKLHMCKECGVVEIPIAKQYCPTCAVIVKRRVAKEWDMAHKGIRRNPQKNYKKYETKYDLTLPILEKRVTSNDYLDKFRPIMQAAKEHGTSYGMITACNR